MLVEPNQGKKQMRFRLMRKMLNYKQHPRALRLLSGFALILFCLFGANLAQSQKSELTTFHTLKIGAGGFIRGLDIQCDQGIGKCINSGTTTKVIRTDTYGAYRYDEDAKNPGNSGGDGMWIQLVTANSLPLDDPMRKVGACGAGEGCGVYEIRIAPSDTRIFYMMMNGYIYRTTDRGHHWTNTRFKQVKTSNPNDGYAQFGPKIAIDPANANVAFVCTETNGCFVTVDGGNSFNAVQGIKNATSVGMLVVYEPTSAVIEGKTQGLYIASYGTGVYHSSDGGQSWDLTAETPPTFEHMKCATNGTLFLTASDSNSNIYVYSSGRWNSYKTGNAGIASFAVNPVNPDEIIALNTFGITSFTESGAAGKWSGYSRGNLRIATDIPWLASTNEDLMTAGDISYDPAESSAVYFAEGIGVWRTTAKSYVDASTPWISVSAGIEQLVSNWAISPPDSNPILTFWDRPAFLINDPEVYPTTHGVDRASQTLQSGWSADWASDKSGTVIVLANTFGGTDTSGYSSDSGRSWHTFLDHSPMLANKTYGGSIAAATALNFVWVPTDDNPHKNSPWYTEDGGVSWKPLVLSGTATDGNTGWGFAYYLDLQRVTSDRVSIGTFYLYNSGDGKHPISGGVWRCTHGGAFCERVSSTVFPNSQYNAKLRSVPGQAGNLFFSAGQQSCPCPSKDGSFYRSNDGGTTWTVVSGVKDVWAFGFGRPNPRGPGYPAIFLYGWVYGVPGVWRSDDNATTWEKLSDQFPNNSLDTVKVVEGDNNVYGKVYIGFSGSGFAYGQLH
jgi:photosystem II stability/assembly factor-like uncharacterized protein